MVTADESVIQPNGQVRQAGASQADGEWVKALRLNAERSLFLFAKAVLGRNRLMSLHRSVCDWLTVIPPYRKLLLLPRDHYKTTIVSQSLPIHILIQPKENNIYRPGFYGADTRVALCGETIGRMQPRLRWLENEFENNQLLKALWPECCWENPSKQSKKWNENELLINRKTSFPESSVQAFGVDTAITGGHFDILIKDDLVSLEAANSEVVMERAIMWHNLSRALMDDPDKSLEFIIGTKWANHDLYSVVQEDDSVECMVRAIIENGQPIMPEVFNEKTINRLKIEMGSMFWLLYMNMPYAADLADFDVAMVRPFKLVGQNLFFDEDERDDILNRRFNLPSNLDIMPKGTHTTFGEYTKDVVERGRAGWMRLKYT